MATSAERAGRPHARFWAKDIPEPREGKYNRNHPLMGEKRYAEAKQMATWTRGGMLANVVRGLAKDASTADGTPAVKPLTLPRDIPAFDMHQVRQAFAKPRHADKALLGPNATMADARAAALARHAKKTVRPTWHRPVDSRRPHRRHHAHESGALTARGRLEGATDTEAPRLATPTRPPTAASSPRTRPAFGGGVRPASHSGRRSVRSGSVVSSASSTTASSRSTDDGNDRMVTATGAYLVVNRTREREREALVNTGLDKQTLEFAQKGDRVFSVFEKLRKSSAFNQKVYPKRGAILRTFFSEGSKMTDAQAGASKDGIAQSQMYFAAGARPWGGQPKVYYPPKTTAFGSKFTG